MEILHNTVSDNCGRQLRKFRRGVYRSWHDSFGILNVRMRITLIRQSPDIYELQDNIEQPALFLAHSGRRAK